MLDALNNHMCRNYVVNILLADGLAPLVIKIFFSKWWPCWEPRWDLRSYLTAHFSDIYRALLCEILNTFDMNTFWTVEIFNGNVFLNFIYLPYICTNAISLVIMYCIKNIRNKKNVQQCGTNSDYCYEYIFCHKSMFSNKQIGDYSCTAINSAS